MSVINISAPHFYNAIAPNSAEGSSPAQDSSLDITIDTHIKQRKHEHSFWFDDHYEARVTTIKDKTTDQVLFTLEQNSRNQHLKIFDRDGQEIVKVNEVYYYGIDLITKSSNPSKTAEYIGTDFTPHVLQNDRVAVLLKDNLTGIQVVVDDACQRENIPTDATNIKVYAPSAWGISLAMKDGVDLFKKEQLKFDKIQAFDAEGNKVAMPNPLFELETERPKNQLF